MKNKLLQLTFLACTVLLVQSCTLFESDETNKNPEAESTRSLAGDTLLIEEHPVKIEDMEIGEEAKQVLMERVFNSPFRNLECCASDDTRFNDCCCTKVLEKYQQLAEKEQLGDLNLKDQILIDCRKGPLSAKFDEVDFAGVEDEYGDI